MRLENESGNGCNNRAMAKWVHDCYPGMMIHYEGESWTVTGDEFLLNTSAYRYRDAAIKLAEHDHLLSLEDSICLNQDYKVSGIGTGSCGPRTFSHYRILPEDGEFSLLFTPKA